MNCPVDQSHFRRVELESGLPAFQCIQCSGHWLRFGDYLAWRERQPGDLSELPTAEPSEIVPDPVAGAARRCPDCGHLLTRHGVGHGVHFALDRCGNCNGIWMDRSEWEALRARGLHDNLHQMFGPGWQYSARSDEQRRRTDAQFERQLGGEDFARAREFAGWLAAHPRRSQLFAYLQSRIR